ncbi:hypothetical protein MY3296_003493 [Beauveria thailandica]
MPAPAAVATAASPTGTARPVDRRRRGRPRLVLMPRAASELTSASSASTWLDTIFHNGGGGVLPKLALRRKLLDDIAAFSPAVWLDERTLQLAKVFGSRTKQAESGSTRSALLDLVQSFQMATILYAIRTLFLDHDDFSSESGILDLQQVEAAAIEALGASLRRIWEMEHASPDWFGKFTVWPLFMLGMSIDPVVEPEETTYFICRSLQRLGHHIRAMTYKDAIWALQHTWERSEKVERSSWLGELPLDVLPGLFFM